jgi:uncharacterized cupredoxin-like copper-binding protein
VVARRLVIALMIGGLVLAACGSSSKSSGSDVTTTTAGIAKARPKVTITARDFSFSAPAEIPAGYVDLTLDNQGKEDHQAQLVKLGSATFDQFKAYAVKTDLSKVKTGTIFVGGPNNVAPGASVTATVKLEPGEYGIVCFIPSPKDGKAHVAKGMIGQLKVAETAASVDRAPVATSTIILGDFSFTVPKGFTGKGTIDVSNQGNQVHEAVLYKLAAGKTVKDATKFLLVAPGSPPPAGPPPFTPIGGTVGLSPQQHAWLALDLAPGNYLLMCFLPDPVKGGLPHAVEGMVRGFTIS